MSDESPQTPNRYRGCGGIFFCAMIVIAAVWGAGLGGFVWLLDDARANIQGLDDFRPKVGSRVYSADGAFLGEYTIETRQLVRLSEIPLQLQKAFLAIEDAKFYEHKGVRPLAFVSVARDAMRTQRLRGASTISMQIVRNLEDVTEVSKERTYQRKLKEILVALQLERELTKDEILELYLNQIFLGGSANGVESAAQLYFGKSCRDLNLSESAVLAGLTSSPNALRPDRYPTQAQARRNVVLQQMLRYGFITREQYDETVAIDIADSVISYEERLKRIAEGRGVWTRDRFQAPYFVEEVRRFIMGRGYVDRDELLENGLQIHTTIDMRLQQAAETALLSHLEAFDEKILKYLKDRGQEDYFVPVSGALVCIDNRPGYEGYVRAMVGGRDFETEKFNTATQALRQPGSSVKPFIWAAAIANGYTPSHIEIDEPITLLDELNRRWSPKNFTGDFKGPVSLRYSLEQSINIVSVKLVMRLSMPVVRTYMQRAGISTEISDMHKRTIALGSPDVTVLDMCTSFATFAKMGLYAPPVFVEEIRDRDDFRMYKGQVSLKRVMPANVAYVLTYLMQGAATYGTGARSADLARPRAGKTGTSNESRNVWFCGYTPYYTAVVWMGYRDNRPLGKGPDNRNMGSSRDYTGGRLACPIWTQFMVAAHKGLPVRDFDVPEGIVFYNVDRRTGVLGGNFREAFIEGTRPPERVVVFADETVEDMMETPILEEF